MVSAAVLSQILTPSVMPDDGSDIINLETMIPGEFGKWKTDTSTTSPIVNPNKAAIYKIYNQTLSRTYINDEGERVMLSIAYGGNQSTDLHVHRPELCYVASGFEIREMTKTFVDTSIGRMPVMHLIAKQGSRNEPITYWIRVGDSLTRGWLEQKLTAIARSLTGNVPDGLLFRVSSISNDETQSYAIQQEFLSGMMLAVKPENRHWLVGKLTPAPIKQ